MLVLLSFIVGILASNAGATPKYKDLEVTNNLKSEFIDVTSLLDSPFFQMDDQVSTPANPPTGKFKLYFKNGNLTKLDEFGAENTVGGASGANFFLSNLQSPTAINEDLIFDKLSPILKTKNNGAGNSEDLNLQTGTATGTRGDIKFDTKNIFYNQNLEISEDFTTFWWGAPALSIFADANPTAGLNNDVFVIGTKDAATDSVSVGTVLLLTGNNIGNGSGATTMTGEMYIQTGFADGSANTGGMFFNSGNKFGASSTGQTGQFEFFTGSHEGTSGQTGQVSIKSGAVTNAANSSPTGSVFIESSGTAGSGTTGALSNVTGNSSLGASGNILHTTGNASTTSGDIISTTGPGSTRGKIKSRSTQIDFWDNDEISFRTSGSDVFSGGTTPKIVFRNVGVLSSATPFTIATEDAFFNAKTASLNILSGGNNTIGTTNPTGDVNIFSGKITNASLGAPGAISGSIFIGSGDVSGAAVPSGDVQIFTGSSSGDSGNIFIGPGGASGLQGFIQFAGRFIEFVAPIVETPGIITLTADDQVIDPTTPSIALNSNSAVSTDRTFVLTKKPIGTRLTIYWNGTNTAELIDDSAQSGGGNHRLSSTWIPTADDVISFISNGTDWLEVSRSTN